MKSFSMLTWMVLLAMFAAMNLPSLGQSFTKKTITLKGKKRFYYVYLPKGLERGKKYPAVIAFHGFESDPGGLRWLISPDADADTFKYIIIYPSAENKSWNAGRGFGSKNRTSDDLSFASALVDVAIARHPVDPQRIYAMGFSNGAQMVALMVCRIPQKIAAAAMIAHTMNIPNCHPKRKVPILLIHGAKDKLAPFAGGGKSQILSHKASVSFFQKLNETREKSKILVNKPTVRCRTYQGEKTEVIDCICFNDGHAWPGGREFKTDIFGTTNKELDATPFIFNFFRKYKGQPPKRTSSALIKSGLKPLATGKDTARQKIKPTSNPKKPVPSAQITLRDRSLKSGKMDLKYFAYAPSSMRGRWQGMVVCFGPESFSAGALARLFKAETYAVRNRWLFVFPKMMRSKGKKQANDLLYPIVADAKAHFEIQGDEVYLLGFGSGARNVQRSFCFDSSYISAAAMSNYGWQEMACKPVPLVPIFIISSKKDPFVAYRGKPQKKELGVPALRRQLLSLWEGNVEASILEKQKTYSLHQWLIHDGAGEILLLETEWGGHGIPGSNYPFPKSYGKTFSGADAIEKTMAFFARHPHHHFGVARDR